MTSVRNCIFDLYGTLVDIHTDEESPEVWRMLAAEFARYDVDFVPEDLHAHYLRFVRQEEAIMLAACPDSSCLPEIQLENVFHKLFALGGVSATEDAVAAIGKTFREVSTEYIRLYDGVPELLAALRQAGKKLWLLSNAQRLFTAWELDRLGLTDYFDGIYLSSDYGFKKPDPRFFRKLLEDQAIDAQSAIMIGNDGTCDIEGAKNAGLRTLYIRSNISPEEALPEADYILTEMSIPRVQEILLRE